MSKTKSILKGTFILTMTGFITRVMGFIYRIFLSRTLGEAGIGLYQLIFPVYAFGFSLTSAGIEIALSRLVANYTAKGNKKRAKELLYTSIIITLILSILFTLLLQKYSYFIATYYLHNEDTHELLLILSYIFPFTAIHSCIVGYYLGLKQTKTPSISQIIEQSSRIIFIFLLYQISKFYHFHFYIAFTVIGLVIGELSSCIYCLKMLTPDIRHRNFPIMSLPTFIYNLKELVILAFPLTASRVLLNILQSIEAVSIPFALISYGSHNSEALAMYGVLTGMALPFILFPSAITNALSTMLLPTISEIQAVKNVSQMLLITKKSIISCTFLGVLCCVFFILFGNLAGSLVFHSSLAGDFIVTLAWMCPFLYTNSTLLSTINGIGKTWVSFIINAISLSIRIITIVFMIPYHGIYGYLCGLLISQIVVFILCLLYLYKYFKAEVL